MIEKTCKDCSLKFLPKSNSQVRCMECRIVYSREVQEYYRRPQDLNELIASKVEDRPSMPCTTRKMTPEEIERYNVKRSEEE